MLVPDE